MRPDRHAGIVGFGLAGRVIHRPLLQAAGFAIAGVVSRQQAAVRECLPDARVLPDIDSLLELPQLDLVVIATPNDLHEPQAIKALRAGLCVVVDKPLAPDTAAAARLLQAARDSSGALTVFFNRRWDSDFLTVRRLLASDELGTLHTFEARWNRYRPQVIERWREMPDNGGGLLLDLGSHLIDQVLQLFGMPQWLEAELMARRVGARVEDAFEMRMGIDGLRIVLGADMLTADPGPRFRLHGSRGSFTKSGLDVQETQLRAQRAPLQPDFGIEPPSQAGLLESGPDTAGRTIGSERGDWLAFYRAMRHHLDQDAPLPVAAADALAGLRVIELARQSAASGRRIALR